MSDHTPTPWRVFTNLDGTKLVGIGVWSWNDPEGIANANLVVEAVNNHETLLNNVEVLKRHLSAATSENEKLSYQLVQAKAALGEARIFLTKMRQPMAPGLHTISSYHPIQALIDRIDAALSYPDDQEKPVPAYADPAFKYDEATGSYRRIKS